MSGSEGNGGGEIYLAHAWVEDDDRQHTVGPWHWWNVYKDPVTADIQARRAAQTCWKGGYGKHESFTLHARDMQGQARR